MINFYQLVFIIVYAMEKINAENRGKPYFQTQG